MNWLSHWDKNLEHVEKIESLQESSVILACYEAPSEKEINTLFGCDNAVECVCKVEEPRTDNLIRCPHCGESYYMEKYSACTAMYFPPIYKDGVNINPDKNITTTHCTCMNCKKDFSYQR